MSTYNWLPGNLNPLMLQGGQRDLSPEDLDASGRGLYQHKQYVVNTLIESNILKGVTRWKAQIISKPNKIQEGSFGWPSFLGGPGATAERYGYRIRIPEIHQTIPFPCEDLDEETKKKYVFMHPEAIMEKDNSLLPGRNLSIGDIVWVSFGIGSTGGRFRNPVIEEVCQKGVAIQQPGECDISSNMPSSRGAFAGNPVVWTGTGPPPVGIGGFDPPRVGNYIGILSADYPQIANGSIPDAVLKHVNYKGDYTDVRLGPYLIVDVVDSWIELAKAFTEHFPGIRIKAGQFMRYYYDGTEYSQVALRISKPNLAARPGTSNHGWALAVDIDLTPGPGWYSTSMNTAQKFASDYYVWLSQNASKYGWHNPSWARQDGSKPEAWHWEYINANSVINPR